MPGSDRAVHRGMGKRESWVVILSFGDGAVLDEDALEGILDRLEDGLEVVAVRAVLEVGGGVSRLMSAYAPVEDSGATLNARDTASPEQAAESSMKVKQAQKE